MLKSDSPTSLSREKSAPESVVRSVSFCGAESGQRCERRVLVGVQSAAACPPYLLAEPLHLATQAGERLEIVLAELLAAFVSLFLGLGLGTLAAVNVALQLCNLLPVGGTSAARSIVSQSRSRSGPRRRHGPTWP